MTGKPCRPQRLSDASDKVLVSLKLRSTMDPPSLVASFAVYEKVMVRGQARGRTCESTVLWL